MPFSEQYRRQASLLVRVLPFVARERCFALKGGTAINLFVRDLPRLSVDIDLAFVPVGDRASALREIDAAFHRIKRSLEGRSEEHTSELQSLMRISYAVFCLKKKKTTTK